MVHACMYVCGCVYQVAVTAVREIRCPGLCLRNAIHLHVDEIVPWVTVHMEGLCRDVG